MVNIGVGGRYWRVASTGTVHFEETPLDGRPQVLHWRLSGTA
ncbi:hypothetical protein ABID19_006685 [Mesorhizobium robiniae]|uniref:Uncharacterized protein n=1 Tax=Mesorhizobium robiniae TaxID=559315 RepID=A0ABV2GZA0_9HYPH|nr:hypothetical protein [Mesorhizobium sp. ZC-5]MCV3244075.1 hypothetical protein [Mesorhizobium sp. ZC-5]